MRVASQLEALLLISHPIVEVLPPELVVRAVGVLVVPHEGGQPLVVKCLLVPHHQANELWVVFASNLRINHLKLIK